MGKIIVLSKQHGGLYYMPPLQRTPTCYQASQSSSLWHIHLGHPSLVRLKLASSLLSSKEIYLDNNCSVCPMAKQTGPPFPLSPISSCSF